MTIENGNASGEPVATLRGAEVNADAHRVRHLVVAVCLLGLVVLVIVLYLAGMHRNDQIARLRQQGVAVELTVTGCRGLLGGSGSNAAGYECSGSFQLNGHRYNERIPGSTLYPPGAILQGVVVPGDPSLLSTVRAVASEHRSSTVFILPTVLLAVLITAVTSLMVGRRRVRGTESR